jgi:hypothetical protein
MYRCTMCPESFPTASGVAVHSATHKIKQFSCVIPGCKHSNTRFDVLQQHYLAAHKKQAWQVKKDNGEIQLVLADVGDEPPKGLKRRKVWPGREKGGRKKGVDEHVTEEMLLDFEDREVEGQVNENHLHAQDMSFAPLRAQSQSRVVHSVEGENQALARLRRIHDREPETRFGEARLRGRELGVTAPKVQSWGWPAHAREREISPPVAQDNQSGVYAGQWELAAPGAPPTAFLESRRLFIKNKKLHLQRELELADIELTSVMKERNMEAEIAKLQATLVERARQLGGMQATLNQREREMMDLRTTLEEREADMADLQLALDKRNQEKMNLEDENASLQETVEDLAAEVRKRRKL